MSRVGCRPIKIPDDVKIELEGERIAVKGPKGELKRKLHPLVQVKIEGGEVRVERRSDGKMACAIHGLTRTLIHNMVEGVRNGYSKMLQIVGVGYRAQLQNKNLVLQLGYSHPIVFKPPNGIEIQVPDPTHIKVVGIDKELVGQIAAKIRRFRPPDPYKAKGIKYEGEYIRRKAGKAGV